MSVSLTRFIDFVNSTGLKKGKIVEDSTGEEKYEPYKDFYKNFREAIIALHKVGAPIETLSSRINWPEGTKKRHFEELVLGYCSWAKNKNLKYIPVESRLFKLGGYLELSINPELSLQIGKKATIIKLYFKADALQKSAADMITTLLVAAYQTEKLKNDYDFAVLDVRNSRLFRLTEKTPINELLKALTIEADAWLKFQAAQ